MGQDGTGQGGGVCGGKARRPSLPLLGLGVLLSYIPILMPSPTQPCGSFREGAELSWGGSLCAAEQAAATLRGTGNCLLGTQ